MNCTLIDVCLPCYLTDHHNRPGEQLLCAPVDGRSDNGDVRMELLNELNTCEFPDGFDYDEARAAIARCFEGTEDAHTFDNDLEVPPDDDYGWETCYAYFLLTY